MRVGVVFPQTELGGDPGAVRAYGERVEELGFTHILAYDHVVGADPAVHTGWNGPYDVHTTFHEPFVMFGYLAAVTRRVELVTGVIILPQRQTAVGRQAGRRSRPAQRAAGCAWESGSAGTPSSTRHSVRSSATAARDQPNRSALLRRLWTEQTVTFDGDFHRVTGAGIAPLPVPTPDSGVDRGGVGSGLSSAPGAWPTGGSR